MDSFKALAERTVLAFWVACACAAVGGLMPIALTGLSGRLSSVVIPYWVAALVLAGCALLHVNGRAMIATLYFVAGLAIVYGMLAMFAVPLKLAVVGTCPVNGRCPAGLQAPLTSAENSVIALAMAGGLLAIGFGFFGLVTLYRRLAPAPSVPTRRIPAVKPFDGSHQAPATTAPAATAPAAEKATPADVAPGGATLDSPPELPAPEEPPELPAHEPPSGEH